MTLGTVASLTRRFIRRGVFGPLLVLAALAVAPAPVQASCVPLDLATLPRTAETAVFAGTVTRVLADHVFMRIEAWFVGADPIEDAEIIGGRGSNDPDVVTSVDWIPAAGERYLVVAERQAPNGFVTKACQQMSVEAGVIEGATAVLGAPLSPPFGPSGSPAASPSPNDGSPTSGATDTLPWVALVALVVLGALMALLMLRQRRHRVGPG